MPDDREEPPNVLGDHVRRGRRYLSRIAALDGFAVNDWVRDDAPDLLWPIMLVGLRGAKGAAAFARLQDAVMDGVGPEQGVGGVVAMDGRLTSLEAVSRQRREAVIEAVDQLDRATIVPDVLIAAASLYDEVPGAWLLLEPWDVPEIPIERALQAMADALIAVIGDRHLNALVKTVPFGWDLRAGRVHLPPEVADDLMGYPAVEENRGKADAFILSSFLAQKSIEEEASPDLRSARLTWGRRFWGSNWKLSECILERDLVTKATHEPDDDTARMRADGDECSVDQEISDKSVPEDEPSNAFEQSDWVGDALKEVDRLVSRLEEAVFDRERVVDLHSPARHEVLAGVGMRACRAVGALLLAPHMWTGEHASGVMRYLIEATIVLEWMRAQGSDDVYREFQAYGRGKRKLQLRHLRATAEAKSSGSDEFVASMIGEMTKRAGGEWSEEIQEVNVESTFSGLSLRQMAHEIGERDLYNHMFQPTSGVAHGEWWSLEDYSLQRCLNPLHRFHLVPQFQWDVPAPNPRFPEPLLASLERVVSAVMQGLDEAPRHE